MSNIETPFFFFPPKFRPAPAASALNTQVKNRALEDGTGFQDMGAIRLPVEIDTHINTKLLMLLVIGVAVLLFIVEWVRVDVVAMAMMVLLPELGLLNVRDTFKGISSNAVMAIIGVMIISYGYQCNSKLVLTENLMHDQES